MKSGRYFIKNHIRSVGRGDAFSVESHTGRFRPGKREQASLDVQGQSSFASTEKTKAAWAPVDSAYCFSSLNSLSAEALRVSATSWALQMLRMLGSECVLSIHNTPARFQERCHRFSLFLKLSWSCFLGLGVSARELFSWGWLCCPWGCGGDLAGLSAWPWPWRKRRVR